MRKQKNRNAGYSLIEMIIVMAIIMIVSVMALLSVTLIASAKVKEAAVTFDSEVATLITKAKNMECDADPTYSYCLKLYKDSDGKYYVKTGYYNPNGATDADRYIFDGTGKGVSLSSYADISYTPTGGVENTSFTECYIRFDRKGLCAEGDGTYKFYKRNGSLVAQCNIRKNGSHDTN
jgi:type II secretory pathway pseudopilin PulG